MREYIFAIGNDHAGFNLKTQILDYLKIAHPEITIYDVGNHSAQTKVDYPDYAAQVVEKIIDNKADYGILICGTGIGMSIAANRYSQIRAALCTTEFMAEKARAHNDANILVLGSNLISQDSAFRMIEIFLKTNFEAERHVQRIEKLTRHGFTQS